MILNITDGNSMSYKEQQLDDPTDVKVKHFEKDKNIQPVTLDITKWVKCLGENDQVDESLQELMNKDSKLIRLKQMKQHFKVFMGCQFQNYSKLVLREEECPDQPNTNNEPNFLQQSLESLSQSQIAAGKQPEKKFRFEIYDTDLRQALMTQAKKVHCHIEIKYQADEEVDDDELKVLKVYYDEVKDRAKKYKVKEDDIDKHLEKSFEDFVKRYQDSNEDQKAIHLDPKERRMNKEKLKDFLKRFKITQEQQDMFRKEATEEDRNVSESFWTSLRQSNDSFLIKMKEIEFYFKDLESEQFDGAKNYFTSTRLQEKIAEYVTEMQSTAKQRQAMRRIEKCVRKLLELLKQDSLDNLMILRQCKWIDSDMEILRHEPGLFDDTDVFNVFPMILSDKCYVRLYQLKNRTAEERKSLTITEVYDAILQIDFQNESGYQNGPQDLLEQKLNKVQEEARECIVQIQQDIEEQENEDNSEGQATVIHCESFQELKYEKDWYTAVEQGKIRYATVKGKQIIQDAECQDCQRSLTEAYGDFEKISEAKENKDHCEDAKKIPYQFIFWNEHLKSVGKFCCADCGVERRAEVHKERFLQLEESTYCFSFISMMIHIKSNVTTIQGLYYKAQTVFFIQFLICLFLIYKNIVSETEKQAFIEATPFTLVMRILTAYLFHIQTLEDAQGAYRRILFLARYPDRFEPKMRFSALMLCCQQFLINLIAEWMNLMILCQLPNFNELIMNYVTFAEILNLDNLYISTQLKYNKKLKEVIDDPSQKPSLQLFKSTKFHRTEQASKCTKFCEQYNRIIYKLIYFYIMPLFVIFVGYIGYNHDLRELKAEEENIENYSWEKYLRSQSKYPIQDNVNGKYIRHKSFNFMENENMQLYMFTVFTVTYLGGKVGFLYYFKDMKWDQIKLTYPFYNRYIGIYIFKIHQLLLYVICVPFLAMAAFKISLFLRHHLFPKLALLGLYFKFLPDNDWDSGKDYHNCTAPYWQEQVDHSWHYNENCKYLPWANLYFYAFLSFNLFNTDFQDAKFADYFHFAMKTLGWPVVFYKVFNQALHAITFGPWHHPDEEGASLIKLKQIVFLATFMTIKYKFQKAERHCYNDKTKSKRARQNIFYAITLLNLFVSFVACMIIGDASFKIYAIMTAPGGEPHFLKKRAKEILIEVWKSELDHWAHYLKFDKVGAYIELYAFIFFMVYIYQNASVWYTSILSEKEKDADNSINKKLTLMKKASQKRKNQLESLQLTQSIKKKEREKQIKLIKKKKQQITKLKRVWLFLVPFQVYYMINFGFSLLYKLLLHRGVKSTMEHGKEFIENMNPLVLFVSAFSAPYFSASYVLSGILFVLQSFVEIFVMPPWEEYKLDNKNTDFKWYKFFIYYQIYLLMLLVYLGFVHWNVNQLQQLRFKSSKSGHMLQKRYKNPYTFKDLQDYKNPNRRINWSSPRRLDESQKEALMDDQVFVQCSQCERVIQDGELFKHCMASKEDYCKKCWIVPPNEVEQYLAPPRQVNRGRRKSMLTVSIQVKIDKSKQMSKIQKWFTGDVEFENESLNSCAKYLPLITIPGTPVFMYVVFNICLYYASYGLFRGCFDLFTLNKGVSQIMLGVIFLGLSIFIFHKIPLDENPTERDSDEDEDVNEDDQEKEEKEKQASCWQTFKQKLVSLKPVKPTVQFILIGITLSLSVSFFMIYFNPRNVADKNFKLGFYTYMFIGVVAAFVWEHSSQESFDSKVAELISIMGLILIGQHILAEVVIYYTWHVLQIVPQQNGYKVGEDLLDMNVNRNQFKYDDYCCWMKEDTSNCDC